MKQLINSPVLNFKIKNSFDFIEFENFTDGIKKIIAAGADDIELILETTDENAEDVSLGLNDPEFDILLKHQKLKLGTKISSFNLIYKIKRISYSEKYQF